MSKITIKLINDNQVKVSAKGNIEDILNMLCQVTCNEAVKLGIKKTEFINCMKQFYDDMKKDDEDKTHSRQK